MQCTRCAGLRVPEISMKEEAESLLCDAFTAGTSSTT